MKHEDITIISGEKRITFDVDVPDDDEEAENGVAYYNNLKEQRGMLYYVPPKAEADMWTKDNRWMGLNCDYMICYVRHKYGGAYSAMKVALANKKEVINIAPQHN